MPELIRAEILSMSAGREMDALIAERVMGEPKPEMSEPEATRIYLEILSGVSTPLSPGNGWRATMDFETGDNPYWEPHPFSTNIVAAWRVVEHLQAPDREYAIDVWREPIFGPNWNITFAGRRARGDTLPLAICRAALLAVCGE